MVALGVFAPYHAIQLGIGKVMALRFSYIYTYWMASSWSKINWAPNKRSTSIGTNPFNTWITNFRYGKWTKVEVPGCSMAKCTFRTTAKQHSISNRAANLGCCIKHDLNISIVKTIFNGMNIDSLRYALDCRTYSFDSSPKGVSWDLILVARFKKIKLWHGNPANINPPSLRRRVHSTARCIPCLMQSPGQKGKVGVTYIIRILSIQRSQKIIWLPNFFFTEFPQFSLERRWLIFFKKKQSFSGINCGSWVLGVRTPPTWPGW